MIVLAGVLLIAVVPLLVRRRLGKTGVEAMVPTGGGNMLEAVCQYLRKEVAEPALQQHTDRFIKYHLERLLLRADRQHPGLAADSRGVVAAGHAPRRDSDRQYLGHGHAGVVTMVMMVVNGLRLGGTAYLAQFCPGPIWMAPLLVPVELIGLRRSHQARMSRNRLRSSGLP